MMATAAVKTTAVKTTAVKEFHMMAEFVMFFPRMVDGEVGLIAPAVSPAP